MFWPKKIISGGQTGADVGGLIGAKRVGIPTGGCAPLGYLTEEGARPEMLKSYGLVESHSANYEERTEENVKNSDATLILATMPSSDGTALTLYYCQKLGKPCILVNPWRNCIVEIRDFINFVRPKVLNIAGNRESISPGLADKTADIIQRVFY
ncbi:YpsA SLOG family protein [Microbulbifer variabilis]|uniref:YpsA SLOG family protein n=1 Tax=Microbulbifer variabilis TaxID=266805 RepID=UPI00035E6800|nr:putative molybdenum carrier protein [Microbulbifer variabilis]